MYMSMYPEMGREIVGNGRGRAAVDEFDRNRVGMGKGVQARLEEDGRVDEVAGVARVDERSNRYGGMVGNEKVNKEREVARLWEGKGCGDWKTATQPDPY